MWIKIQTTLADRLSVYVQTKQLCVGVHCSQLTLKYCTSLRKDFLDIQTVAQCRLTVKRVCDIAKNFF